MMRSSVSLRRMRGTRTSSAGLNAMSRFRTAERRTALASRSTRPTVAGFRRAPSAVIHSWSPRWSMLLSGTSPHRGRTCVSMIERSFAAVVASVFQVAIQRRACSPNSSRPACGDT